MPENERRFPPPPPNRPIPPRPIEDPEVKVDANQQQEAVQEPVKKKQLSEKARFGLLIAGGVLSLAVAGVCLALIFVI